MRELRGKMRLVGALIVCLFVGLGVWYGYTVYSQGSVWASNPYNTRSNGSTAHMGDITDRAHRLGRHPPVSYQRIRPPRPFTDYRRPDGHERHRRGKLLFFHAFEHLRFAD